MTALALFFRSAWGFAKLIPWPVYAVAALVALHFWLVHVRVKQAVEETNAGWVAKLASERAAYDKALAALREKQQEVVTRTVIEYRDRIKIVKERADAIVAEIPEVLPVGDSPLLSGGVRVIHDAAAVGNLPNDPVGAAATAAPVETAALLTTVAENYRECSVTSERLIALQKLVKSLEGVNP